VGRPSEIFEFRRAFVWLLCAVLVPSVALVAFGVVAVANERAAVERQLAEEYGGKLKVLDRELADRLETAANDASAAWAREDASPTSGTPPPRDPLLGALVPPEAAEALGLVSALRTVAALPRGAHSFAAAPGGADQGLFAVVTRSRPPAAGAVRIDLAALAREVDKLPAAHGARERALFRLVALREMDQGPSLRRIVAEVAPSGRATPVARLPLGPPLQGFALVAELPGDDPAANAVVRNRTLYIVLLVLLYTSIGVGFGLTLRELYRGAQLSQLKTDFVATISHELRTPLTSVRLFAETLQSGRAKGEEVQECLDILAKESERLSVLVERLLDWSQLESGRRVLNRSAVEVAALLAHIAEAFRAQQLGASYETEIEPGLPPVDVDPEAMAQVVLNLLHNAVKYTPLEGRRIQLRALRGGPGHGEVAIEVADNGPGVRATDRKRIFERFYRADDLLSRRTEGTGLGLAIAKRIVEGHGGRIELDTRVGHGSTFRVLLPVAHS
jgi:two-component system phosphate regulon sensor histidine kinase PhoR